jgi:cytochrome b subunit of formate dehydrogenase
MRRISYFFKELYSACNYVLDYAIKFIGVGLIIYGIVILHKFFARHEPMQLTTEQLVLAYAGLILIFGFIATIIIATIKTFRKDSPYFRDTDSERIKKLKKRVDTLERKWHRSKSK